jgi:heat-inducible transcriptional repressor
MPKNGPATGPADGEEVRLTERQQDVLRAAIRAYVGEAAPIGSKHISHLLLKKLSSASIRSTLAELGALGLVHQPHTSAVAVPTEQGLRTFIDRLLERRDVAEYDRRAIEYSVDNAPSDAVVEVAAQLLSQQTRPARVRDRAAARPRDAPAREPRCGSRPAACSRCSCPPRATPIAA